MGTIERPARSMKKDIGHFAASWSVVPINGSIYPRRGGHRVTDIGTIRGRTRATASSKRARCYARRMPFLRVLGDTEIARGHVQRCDWAVCLLLPCTACVDDKPESIVAVASTESGGDAGATDPTDRIDGGEDGDDGLSAVDASAAPGPIEPIEAGTSTAVGSPADVIDADIPDARAPIEALPDASTSTVIDSSVDVLDADTAEAGVDAAHVACDDRPALEWKASELPDASTTERAVARYAGCGYVLGFASNWDYQWTPNGDVHCPLLGRAECDGLRDDLFGTPQPCETDDDCELWNPLSCENVAGFTNIPVSLLLTREERMSLQQTLDQFTNGGCGNRYSTGYDGPIEAAACEQNVCTTRENRWCGAAAESDGG